ncbi:MAG TPA: SH3 domain-containing protein [Aggregatilinea sp.]|uniref:SH3 domain-containing protein n=1 Tax=Aggregatilinea sp. TaxID=2806333 RepID=UPI002CBD5020|nr:SH3 domain-containing protein [Aggregatilinea sp.]HML23627.1 SH3 domain-containing protein [Aggregatilinea sp.]
MYHTKFFRIILVTLVMLFTGCQGAKVRVKYEVLFVTVTIDTSGQVSVSASTPKFVTPIGSFSAGLVVDPNAYFKKDDLLIVRFNGVEKFYDLHGNDVSVSFESDYYKGITIETSNGNVLVDIWTPSYVPPASGGSFDTGSVLSGELVPGSHARVHTTDGDSLRLRIKPSASANVVVGLPNGVVVTIVDGPKTADGYTWWKVHTSDNQEGWCVESADGIQTLQRYSSVSIPHNDGSCGGKSIRFSIGEEVIVSTKGNALRILTDPTGGALETRAQAVSQDRLQILDGPICEYSTRYDQDILYWYIYSYADKVQGWVADGIQIETWLCPLSNSRCDE